MTRATSRYWLGYGAAVVTAALIVEYSAQFGRSIVLTRALGPVEFGISSAMVILLTLIDMSTGIGADRFLVQAEDGDGQVSLGVAHTLMLFRGLLNAGLVAVLAVPSAMMLGVPQASGSFLWLALIPILRSFENLQLEQSQRQQRFGAWAIASAVSNVLGFAVIVAAATTLRDHRAVIWGLGGQAIGLAIATHYMADSKYRVSFAKGPMIRALHFGLPLMLNGLALAALSQVDRLAVGSILGIAQLGCYTVAAMTFYLPSSVLLRVVMTVLQPRLSATWHASPLREFPRLFRRLNIGMATLGCVVGTGVVLGGEPTVRMLFGPSYAVGDLFFAVYGLATFARFSKSSGNFGGLAIGRTVDLMLSNVPAALGLGVTILGLKLKPLLVVAAGGALVGEMLGSIIAFRRLAAHLNVTVRACWVPFLCVLPVPCAAGAWVLLVRPSVELRACVLAVLVATIACRALLVGPRMRAQLAS